MRVLLLLIILDGTEPANGTAVDRWQDLSGHDHDAVTVTDLATTLSSPTRLEVTISVPGGNHTFPVVRFTAGDELLRASDIISSTGSMAWVKRPKMKTWANLPSSPST